MKHLVLGFIFFSVFFVGCIEEVSEPQIVCTTPKYDTNGWLMYTQYIYDNGTCKVVYSDKSVGPHWVDWCTCNE